MGQNTLDLFYQTLLADLKQADHILTATIQVPRGQILPHWDTPCTADYGYIEGYIDPIDGDPLGIYLIKYVIRFEKGQSIRTRIVGILKNRDGDITLLGAPPQNFRFSSEDIDALVKRENIHRPGTKAELFG